MAWRRRGMGLKIGRDDRFGPRRRFTQGDGQVLKQ